MLSPEVILWNLLGESLKSRFDMRSCGARPALKGGLWSDVFLGFPRLGETDLEGRLFRLLPSRLGHSQMQCSSCFATLRFGECFRLGVVMMASSSVSEEEEGGRTNGIFLAECFCKTKR